MIETKVSLKRTLYVVVCSGITYYMLWYKLTRWDLVNVLFTNSLPFCYYYVRL